IMTRYMLEQPGARVELEVANTSTIVRKLANFELDLGMIEGENLHPDLKMLYWKEDELVVFCAPDHELAGKPWLTDEDLLQAEWIVREPGSGTRQNFEWALHGILPQLNIKLELQHTEAIKRAVEAGLGVGCLSAITLGDAFRRGTLVPLPVPHRDFKRGLYFVRHRNKFISAGMRRWLELCRESQPDCERVVACVRHRDKFVGAGMRRGLDVGRERQRDVEAGVGRGRERGGGTPRETRGAQEPSEHRLTVLQGDAVPGVAIHGY